jgi:UDP-glucose 4-epimerase
LRSLVTGAAGFLGSQTVDRLLADGHEVIGIDNCITGRRQFLERACASPRFQFILGDLFDYTTVSEVCPGVDAVFHLAAHSNLRDGAEFPRRDLDQNVIVTWNVLEAMRRHGVGTLVYASTASLYGATTLVPTPEIARLPDQTTLLCASKLAAEAFITAYAHTYGLRALLLRPATIVGERQSHGHLFHFCRQLHHHPGHLDVPGHPALRRGYLDVVDCVDAMLLALSHATAPVEIFNVGALSHHSLADAIAWTTSELQLDPVIHYHPPPAIAGSAVPTLHLDCSKLTNLGWRPQTSPETAVRRAVRYLTANPWLLAAGC